MEIGHSNERKIIYEQYSKYFTHTTPSFGFLVTTDNRRITEPTLREEHLEFCLFELNLWIGYAMASYISNLYPKEIRPQDSQHDILISQIKDYLFETKVKK